MWAHAEYIKLLRSVSDGAVFDLIPVVSNRYVRRQGPLRTDLTIWKYTRQAKYIPTGSVLRVIAAGAFRVRWTFDAGHTGPGAAGAVPALPGMREVASTANEVGIDFVDIAIPIGQTGTLRFSFAESATPVPQDTTYQVQVVADRSK
jgi:glucoamylase